MSKLCLVGDGVIKRSDTLLRWLSPQWKPVIYSGDMPAGERAEIRAAIGMPGALEWKREFVNLEFLQLPGAGLDGLKKEHLAGVSVANVYEHEGSIAEYVFAAIFANTSSWVYESDKALRAGNWPHFDRVGFGPRPSLAGKTFGVLGWGHIGQRCTDIATAMNMKALVWTRNGKPRAMFGHNPNVEFATNMDEVLRRSDVLLLSLPLNSETASILNKENLKLLRKTALLVNVARAGLVDEEALFNVLESRQIGGAILDTWYQYPKNADEKIHGSRFAFHNLSNVLVTPHLAAHTEDMINGRWHFMAKNLNRFISQEEISNRVLLEKL